VTLESMRTGLGVMFRALGGNGGVRLAAGGAAVSGHRLSLWQRIGIGSEKLDRATLDGATLQLPAQIDLFPDRADNAALYEWLAAWFAVAGPAPDLPADPLQADLVRLRATHGNTVRALEVWPGLGRLQGRLCAALRAVRPHRRLPDRERAVEAVVGRLIGDVPDDATDTLMLAAVLDPAVPLDGFRAPRGYRPFLPVPLWGEVVPAVTGGRDSASEAETDGAGAEGDGKRRKATRRQNDQTRRDDPLVLNRFEKIIGLAEMININRDVEDDDKDNAKQTAEDLDEISVGRHDKRAATRLKLELDLAPEEADTTPLRAERTYPEWDWKRRCYHKDHCRVIAEPAALEGEDWRPDAATLRRIRQVRRQFEALRPKRQVFPAQPDGDDLDLSAVVRDRADRKAGGPGSDRLYSSVRRAVRDLSVCVLMDVSLSTDAWIEDRRVLDVEKEAVMALSHGLSACGDDHAILAFTSKRRDHVSVRTVKDFDDRLDARVLRRIQALKPGYYTRIGAAVRHAVTRLDQWPHHHRLLLLLTDGKPNDMDHYEGRYAIEDTRMAIREARKAGIKVFGVTVDEQARDYFPYLFGRGAYAIFPHIARLPAIYRQVTA
jgi:nitric oxide reductase NorD protein